MAEGLPPASGLRRSLAVIVDVVVFNVVWAVVGTTVPYGSLFYALALFLVLDVFWTGYLGSSPGRYLTRIRVVRAADDGRPGLGPALVRTGLVAISGWLGVFTYLIRLRFLDEGPARMWWDAAAGTRIVVAARPPAAQSLESR